MAATIQAEGASDNTIRGQAFAAAVQLFALAADHIQRNDRHAAIILGHICQVSLVRCGGGEAKAIGLSVISQYALGAVRV